MHQVTTALVLIVVMIDPSVPPAGDGVDHEHADDAGDLAGADFADLSLDQDWIVDVQPYVWVPLRIDGDVTVKGIRADVGLTLSDIFDQADVFAVQGRVEAWRDRFGFYFDSMYVSLDGEGFDATAGPISLSAGVEMQNAMVDFGLGWRIMRTSLAPDAPEGPKLTADLFGGARYQYARAEISRSLFPTLTESTDWLEPVVGGRIKLELDEHLALVVRGDVGGFGIGSASELTWNLGGGLEIEFSKTFSLNLAYRAMGLDFSSGSGPSEFGADVTMHGPWIGLRFRF